MPVDFVTSYVDYVPNPGSDVTPLSPCVDPEMTPQLVCGTLSPPASGATEELQWVQINYTNGSGAAQAFAGTSTLARRASVGGPATNTANITIGPNSNANADTVAPGQFGYIIEQPDGTSFDLSDWFGKSASPGQELIILYLPG